MEMNQPGQVSVKEWFSEWFNSPYYHILYKNRDENEARFFIDNLIRFLDIGATNRVLDLACGRGRHSVYLNSKGFNVTGIDIAPQNIAYARQFENEQLRFFVHDMREPFREDAFCYVLNLFTSFGYFETEGENVNVLCSAARALKPGGKLVVDFMNTHKIINGLVPYQVKEVEGIRFEITKRVEKRFIVKDIRFQDCGHLYHFQERVKTITLEDFLNYFDMADLDLLHTFGDYALNPYDVRTSDRIILIAQKPVMESFGKL